MNLSGPLSLVDGTRVVHGAFVISELNEARCSSSDGAERRIEFQLSLLHDEPRT